MASFNKVILMGNLTRDPELRMTPSGNAICNIGIATTRTFKGADGNMREETTFVDVDAFGRQAETISKYFSKGKPILIEGRLRFDQWESPNGEKRSKLKVTLENFTFVGSRSDNEGGGRPDQGNYTQVSPPVREQAAPPPQSNPAPPAAEDIDDDVPF